MNVNKHRTRIASIGMVILCLLLIGTSATRAQAPEVVVVGKLVDAEQNPVAGYRVVYVQSEGTDARVSSPTDLNGEYWISVLEGVAYMPSAVLLPQGKRIELEEMPSVVGATGARQDIQLTVPVEAPPPTFEPTFSGADRLFLSFVEDTAIADRLRAEGQLVYSGFESSDVFVARGIVAYQSFALPSVEFGARWGLGSRSAEGNRPDGSGGTDLELWAKMKMERGMSRRPEVAFGGLVTVPVGDNDAALGSDALRSELFGAARYVFSGAPNVALSATLGIRFNGNGDIAGVPLNGRTAGRLGAAALWAWRTNLTVIGELNFESKQFENTEADARLLGGVNWKLIRLGSLRLALGFGLSDGAPDAQLIAGYSFDW
jgi:hypothetical protein